MNKKDDTLSLLIKAWPTLSPWQQWRIYLLFLFFVWRHRVRGWLEALNIWL
jgi:hypothetical protein